MRNQRYTPSWQRRRASVDGLQRRTGDAQVVIHDSLDVPGDELSTLRFAGALALYRSLVAGAERLSPVPLAPATAS
jgi:hypothetical protein